MDMLESSRQLLMAVADQAVIYIRVEPFLPDFTVHQEAEVIISASGGRESRLLLSQDTAFNVKALIEAITVQDGPRTVIGWGLKNLFSYISYTLAPLEIGKFFDLKVIENFYGLYLKPPDTMEEATSRLTQIKEPAWRSVYEKVYVPLISRVLPALETQGLLDVEKKRTVHTYYDIEAQVNGRMNSYGLSHGFNAHGMGRPAHLKPRNNDDVFVCFDLSSMEVTLLGWLSGDPKLNAIVKSGRDVYETIWKLLNGTPCNSILRKMIKDTMLATIYGQGAASLSEKTKIPEETCLNLIHRLKELFPVAFGYLSNCQKSAVDGRALDVLGRPRTFPEDKLYIIRNFVVQAPAAMVCLEKLVALHDALLNSGHIVASVHDGYSIVCHRARYVEVVKKGLEVLEAESILCPGLKFRAACKVGDRLNELADPPEVNE
jgi:hypothetical protein